MSDVLDHLAHERKMVRTSIELMKKTEQRLTAAITLLRPSFPGWKDPTEKTKAPALKVKVPVITVPKIKAAPRKPTPERMEQYQKVMDVAVHAVGLGQDPVKAVAHAFGWKESTATTTMVEARRAGFDVPKKNGHGNAVVVHASPSAPTLDAHAD